MKYRHALKFMFSKKAAEFDKIFTADLTLCSICQIVGEDFVKFWGLLRKHELYQPILIHSIPTVCITHFFKCMAIHLILMAVSCLRLHCQLNSQPPKPVHCTGSSSDSFYSTLVPADLWIQCLLDYSDMQAILITSGIKVK